MTRIKDLDVVRFREHHFGWPAGTTGTVVETDRHAVLVEIAGSGGRTLDVVGVSRGRVELVQRPGDNP